MPSAAGRGLPPLVGPLIMTVPQRVDGVDNRPSGEGLPGLAAGLPTPPTCSAAATDTSQTLYFHQPPAR